MPMPRTLRADRHALAADCHGSHIPATPPPLRTATAHPRSPAALQGLFRHVDDPVFDANEKKKKQKPKKRLIGSDGAEANFYWEGQLRGDRTAPPPERKVLKPAPKRFGKGSKHHSGSHLPAENLAIAHAALTGSPAPKPIQPKEWDKPKPTPVQPKPTRAPQKATPAQPPSEPSVAAGGPSEASSPSKESHTKYRVVDANGRRVGSAEEEGHKLWTPPPPFVPRAAPKKVARPELVRVREREAIARETAAARMFLPGAAQGMAKTKTVTLSKEERAVVKLQAAQRGTKARDLLEHQDTAAYQIQLAFANRKRCRPPD